MPKEYKIAVDPDIPLDQHGRCWAAIKAKKMEAQT